MAEKTRRQVDIAPNNLKQLEAVRRECKQVGATIPTLTILVNHAVCVGLAQTVSKFWPAESKPPETTVTTATPPGTTTTV